MAPKVKRPPKIASPAEPLPEKPIRPRGRYVWYLLAFIVAAGVLAWASYLAYQRSLTGWEYAWLAFVNGWPESWRNYFLVANIAPNALWFGLAAVVVAYVLKLYRLAWRLAASILLGTGLVYVIKNVIVRARPEDLVGGIHVRTTELTPGFPSGHAMMITVVLLTLFPYLPKGWRIPVLLLIPIVALSRLYLGVHAPLDVIGGVAVGVVVIAGIRILPQVIRRWLRLS